MEDYDGIKERQDTVNRLPLGWLAFFIGVIVWGVWYMFMYVPVGTWSQEEEYAAEVSASAPAQAPAPAAQAVPAANPYKGSAHEIEEGAKLYAANCAGCHGANAEGGIAPPLANVETYIYGGTDAELLTSVMEGRGGGMPPFKSSLGEKKTWEVLAYIDSL